LFGYFDFLPFDLPFTLPFIDAFPLHGMGVSPFFTRTISFYIGHRENEIWMVEEIQLRNAGIISF